MSVFAEIDKRYAAFSAEMDRTKSAARELGGSYVRADEFGWWTCRVTKHGDRQDFRARSGDALIKALEAAQKKAQTT